MIDANEYYLKKHEADVVENDLAQEAKEKRIEKTYKDLLTSQSDVLTAAQESIDSDSFIHDALYVFFKDKNFEMVGKLFVEIVENELQAEAVRMNN